MFKHFMNIKLLKSAPFQNIFSKIHYRYLKILLLRFLMYKHLINIKLMKHLIHTFFSQNQLKTIFTMFIITMFIQLLRIN